MSNPLDDALDAALLKVACGAWVDGNATEDYVDRQAFVEEGEKHAVSAADVRDALETLCARGYLKGYPVDGPAASAFTATHRGQKAYLQARDATYAPTYDRVANEVVKHEHMVRNWEVARTVGLTNGLANHFLFELCDHGEATRQGESAGGSGGLRFYVTATAQLRRRLRGA